jgi:hypothetical protein
MKISKTLLAAALSVVSLGAFADGTVLGSTFASGSSTKATILGTFSAAGGTGVFGLKTTPQGVVGVGVNGGTAGEIDVGESITGVFDHGYLIKQFTLGLLFDGPEWKDVQEKAQISVKYAGSSTFTDYVLTAMRSAGGDVATWTGFGSVVNLSKATQTTGGVWSVLNPFGNAKIDVIKFTSLMGVAPAALCDGTPCTNQSDYTLVSVTAVPEVETYAMMLAGLGLMGTIARRRNKAKTA